MGCNSSKDKKNEEKNQALKTVSNNTVNNVKVNSQTANLKDENDWLSKLKDEVDLSYIEEKK